jgi:hypothetical protein
MESGIVIVDVPEQVDKYSGPVRVKAVEGEFLTLDLGGKGELVLQAKVRGGPLRAAVGDKGQVAFRQGDPFKRNDLLTLKLPNDALLYAIIGGSRPVRVSAKEFDLSARQLSPSEVKGEVNVEQANQTDLRLSLRGETHTLSPGEQADFDSAKMTIKLLASQAIEGEAADAVEGDPYRVVLFGWRTLP